MKVSLPVLIVSKVLANTLTVYAMHLFVPAYFLISNALSAYLLVGILIGFLNVLVRPILTIALLPLKFFASLLFLILVNSAILWLTVRFTALMNPDLVRFTIQGGIVGWIVSALAFGLLNWIVRSSFRLR